MGPGAAAAQAGQADAAHWRRQLDALEAALDRAELVLRGRPDVDPEPPWRLDPVGPIPEELRQRARDLQRRQAEMTARLAAALEHVGSELATISAAAHHRDTSVTPPAIFFDGRA